MASILFRCPNCSQGLSADGKAVGSTVECSACGWQAVAPVPDIAWKCPACSSALSSSSAQSGNGLDCPTCGGPVTVPAGPRGGNPRLHLAKKCLSCNADMALDAVVCVSCGHDCRTRRQLPLRPGAPAGLPTHRTRPTPPGERRLPLTVCMPVLAILAAAGIAGWMLWRTKEPAMPPPVADNADADARAASNALHSAILPEFEFRQAVLGDVAAFLDKAFREQAGPNVKAVRFVMDFALMAGPAESQPPAPQVTMLGSDMPFDTVLDLVAEAAGCAWMTDGNIVAIRPSKGPTAPPNPATAGSVADTAAMRQRLRSAMIPEVEFRQADIQDIVGFLWDAFRKAVPKGKAANIALIPRTKAGVPSSVPQVTMAAKDISIAGVLDVVARVANLSWSAAGNVVIVRTREEGESTNETTCEDASAQFALGNAYLCGGSGRTNLQEAALWFRRAAEQGHVDAQYALGYCLFTGKGVERNAVEAASWWRRAADGSNVNARTRLGMCYFNGEGVPQDRARGMALIRTSAVDGDDVAQHLLGLTLYTQGAVTNVEEALHWLRKSSVNGNSDASADLAAAKNQLARKAFDVLGSRKNDPKFAPDGDLTCVANAVVKMRDRTSFPTDKECDSLLQACRRLLEGGLHDDMRRAVIGSRLLFEHEQDMMAKGYRRYAGVFMDENSIAEARKNAAEAKRAATKRTKTAPADQYENSYRVLKEFGDSEDAYAYAKSLEKHSGRHGNPAATYYYVEQRGKHWLVCAGDRSSPSSGSTTWQVRPATATEYRDFMRETFGGRVGVTYNAGEFGPIINPGGINW